MAQSKAERQAERLEKNAENQEHQDNWGIPDRGRGTTEEKAPKTAKARDARHEKVAKDEDDES